MAMESDTIGSFEVFTKGVGSKIMTSLGWKTGEGLGKNRKGIVTPLNGADEGQSPGDKSGFGYHSRARPASGSSGQTFIADKASPVDTKLTVIFFFSESYAFEAHFHHDNVYLYRCCATSSCHAALYLLWGCRWSKVLCMQGMVLLPTLPG